VKKRKEREKVRRKKGIKKGKKCIIVSDDQIGNKV
jgi:hypothetical protein